MHISVEKVDYEELNKTLTIKGILTSKINKDNLRIIFRERNNEKYGIVFKSMIEGELYFKENKFKAIFNFQKLDLNRGDKILDLYFIDEESNKYAVPVINLFNVIPLNLEHQFLKVHLYNQNNKLYLKYDNKISANIQKIKVNGKELEISFNFNDFNIDKNLINVILRQRLTRDIFTYKNFSIYKVNKEENDYHAIISLNDDFIYSENEAYDFFIEIVMPSGESLEIPLLSEFGSETKVIINKFYKGLIYVNYRKQLAILAKTENIKINFLGIDMQNMLMKLMIRIDESIDSQIRINYVSVEPLMKYNSNTLVPYSYPLKKFLQNSQFFYYFNLSDFINKKNIYDELSLGIFVELINNDDLSTCKIPLIVPKDLNIDKECKQINEKFNVMINIKNQQLCLLFKEKIKEINYNPVKIAILGSCMSRLAFTSKDYFNPQYKSKYKVVHTSFHTSLISLFGKPMNNIEEVSNNYFKYLKSPILQNYIKDDMKKNFFNNIKDTKPNFLIIDLYQDAVRDIIIFDDNSTLSAGINLRESEYLDSIKNHAQIITHNEVQLFMSKWEQAVELFAKEIVNYISPNRIIINCQDSVNEYIDRNGKRVKYKTLDQFVKRNNYFFDYMSKALLNALPQSQLIDLSSLKYAASATHPEGNTPTHFEKEYYSEFIKRLDDIVLKTLLSENKIDLE